MNPSVSYFKASKAIIFIALALLALTLVYASSFIDDTQAEFDQGTYENTAYNGTAVLLSGTNITGNYTSRVFDAGNNANWTVIAWQAAAPTINRLAAVDTSADVWESIDSGATWLRIKDDYNNGDGNGITDMAKNSSGDLFILFNQDIWLSPNGTNWTKINDDYNGAEGQNGNVLASDKNEALFVIESDEDVWNSNDSGKTWAKTSANFNGANGDIFGIVVNDSNTIFAVDAASDVWFSNDSGISWSLVKDDYNGAKANGATDMAINSSGALFILDSQDLWSSTDAGITWTLVNDDFNGAGDSNSGTVIYIDNNYIYIIDSSEDVYLSSDSGATFSKSISNLNGGNGNVNGLASTTSISNISFQLKNCSSADCSDSIYIGPDGTPNSFFTGSSNNINLKGRYFQYKSYLLTEDSTLIPAIYNLTIEYVACVPNLMNTSWSSWLNISCLPVDIMNQTRNLTQYDSNYCGEISNTTFTEYRATESCDYCTPILTNTSWSDWINISCLSNDTMNQSRTLVQYDSNNCGEILNETFAEFRATEYCNFSAPDATAPSIISSSPLNGSSLSAGTALYNITLATDETAICRYSNIQNISWENMSQMNYTNSTNHSILAEGLSDGNTYFYYFICEDDESPANQMNSSYALQFSISSPGSSGGGGGGGGGGGSTTIKKTEAPLSPKAEEPKCSESWSCSEWYECASGVQARTCKDVNNCGTSASKPKESQKCGTKKEELSGESLKEDSSITGQAIKVLPYQSPKTQYLIPTILFFVAFIALTSVKKNRMAKKTKRLISILDISMMGMVIILFASSVMNNSSAIGSFLADSTIKSIGITNTANTINNITFPVLIAAFILAAISFIMIMIEREHIRRLTEYEHHNLKAIHHNHSKSSIIHILKKIYKL